MMSRVVWPHAHLLRDELDNPGISEENHAIRPGQWDAVFPRRVPARGSALLRRDVTGDGIMHCVGNCMPCCDSEEGVQT